MPRRRQTSRREILERAARKRLAPRAYQSGLSCGGFAGQSFVVEQNQGADSYVGYPSGTVADASQPLSVYKHAAQAVVFTLDSGCKLVDPVGRILNVKSTQVDTVSVSTAARIQQSGAYNLICRGDANNGLTCTRAGATASGLFYIFGGNLRFGDARFGASPYYQTYFLPYIVNV